MDKKFIKNIVLGVLIVGTGLLIFLATKPKLINHSKSNNNNLNKAGVIISTDKTEYNKGEIVKIVVTNYLVKSILYSPDGDRFWSIEYFKDNKWLNFDRKEGWGFQLTDKNVGDTCHIVLYERTPLVELKPQDSITYQWNQKICPFGTAKPAEPRIVRYIDSGRYRLVFYYGFEKSANDPYQLSDSQTIYSNIFTIR